MLKDPLSGQIFNLGFVDRLCNRCITALDKLNYGFAYFWSSPISKYTARTKVNQGVNSDPIITAKLVSKSMKHSVEQKVEDSLEYHGRCQLFDYFFKALLFAYFLRIDEKFNATKLASTFLTR